MRRFRTSPSPDDGAAAVEFAIIVPLLLLVLFGILSFGLYFAGALGLSNASREAARYGVVQQRTCAAIVIQARDNITSTIGVQYSAASPLTITVSRPTTSGTLSCVGKISTPGGAPTYTGAASTTVMCAGSGSTYDELTVASSATANLFIPGWFVNKNYPLNARGSYRCEFS